MNDYREIEVKLYMPDLDTVRAHLEAADATLTAPRIYERNIRYDDAAHTITGQGVVLRLRQDTRARLTYKSDGKLLDNGLFSRFEAEVTVSDFEAMDTILRHLGFETAFIYEKYRTTYTLDAAEVVLDEMPFGNFVEIEGDEASIVRALDRLALNDAPRYDAGYAMLFDTVRRNLGLTFRDLTFENFASIAVPETAFK
ncbi:MAG: class IV adenylate cyclase [Anaerolineae bacterium]|nr:class IV adenylate cyclase [Anaerolineae bacterium]MCA9909743.1 class IV adenylate cyclase [Anaerolineae bacterium]